MSVTQTRNPELPEILAPDFPICWVPIHQEELGAGGGTFTINPPIPNTYRNLALFCQLRSDDANGVELDFVNLTLNNDGGANYDYAWFRARADNNLQAGGATGANFIQIGQIEAANSRANVFTPLIIWIQGYKFADREKMVYCSNSGAFGDRSAVADLFIRLDRGAWRSQVAITRIDLVPQNGTKFEEKSRVELYGIL